MSQAGTYLTTQLRSFARSGGLGSLRGQLLIITAVLVIAAVILMGTTVSSLRRSLEETEAAENTILEITTVESRLIDFNGSLGVYVLTGDSWFERRLTRNRAQMDIAMRKLKHSLRNDPEQLKTYADMAPLFRKRDALVETLRAPEHHGDLLRPDVARASIAATDAIRGRLWAILEAERDKRLQHHAMMIGEARKSFWLSVGIVTFTFLIGVSFFWLSASTKPGTPARR